MSRQETIEDREDNEATVTTVCLVFRCSSLAVVACGWPRLCRATAGSACSGAFRYTGPAPSGNRSNPGDVPASGDRPFLGLWASQFHFTMAPGVSFALSGPQ